MMVEVLERELEAPAAPALDKPFPGPRPFAEDEVSLFFGRATEISQLRSLVLANSLVLLYAASGAGKSSLIHAGVVPALRKQHATVYPVLTIRNAGDQGVGLGIANPYIRALAVNWTIIADKQSPLPEGRSHAEMLQGVRDLKGFVELLARECEAPADLPRVLVIDQFEELFTFLPAQWESREGVFSQIAATKEADPALSILLAMREDYLPRTDPYAKLVPNHLQQRFRLETLRREQALKAIRGPLTHTDRSFGPGAAESLVDELLVIHTDPRLQQTATPAPTRELGEYVEPVQLQVVCRRLWDALPADVTVITEDEVSKHADVDEALRRFYDDAVRSAAHSGLRAREHRIRDWIGTNLITGGRTRGIVHHDAAVKARVPEAALESLVQWHLLRREWRNNSEFYELTHDRLIDPILASNREYHERRTERLVWILGTVLGLLFSVAAVVVFLVLLKSPGVKKVVLTRTVTTPAVSLPSTTPSPPLITVPATGALYRRGARIPAGYSCASTARWTVRRCTGSVPSGRPIDTRQLGLRRFKVTATYGRSDIVTTRNVTYTVVGFTSRVYVGSAFSVAYPAHWGLATAESPRAGYTDTTIVSPQNPDILLRIDVTPRPPTTLAAQVRGEMRTVAREARYRRISFKSLRVNGVPALDWQFVLLQHGVMLRKDDEFFDYGKGSDRFAVLTEAPVRAYPRLAAEFAALRASLAPH